MKAWWLVAAIGVLLTGCPAPKPTNESTTGVANEAARPALRVRVQADEAFCELISRQWQSISEQPIEVVPITEEEMAAEKLPTADVAVFESRWLPTWAERDGLVPLPKSMLEPEGSGGSTSNSQSMAGGWPVAWKAAAEYGKRTWGVPLGLPMAVKIARNVESKATAIDSATQEKWLVDRFLIEAVDQAPEALESGFLFYLNDGRSRLDERWMIEFAMEFGKRYHSNPAAAWTSPTSAWEQVVTGSSRSAVGWPSSDVVSNVAGTEGTSLEVTAPKQWLDSGRGLVACIARGSRQSSASIRFLKWLNEGEQRQALSQRDRRVQPTPDHWKSISMRPEVRAYEEQLLRGLEDRNVVRELQFAEFEPYRMRLGQTLQRVVASPETAAEAMKACHGDWNALTEQIGRETAKLRLLRAYGLEAFVPK